MVRSIPLFYPACFQDFFLPCPFPENVKKWSSEFNIQKWARATPPNLVCTNGSVQFFAHREVLSLVSTFFKSALQHDQTCTVISMTSVSDEAMEFIYKCIYGNPHTPERNPEFESISHSLFMNLYLTCNKYKIYVVISTLEDWISHVPWINHLNRFAAIYNFIISHDEIDSPPDHHGMQFDLYRTLQSYDHLREEHLHIIPNHAIEAMLEEHITSIWLNGCGILDPVDSCAWRFFQEVVSYAKKSGNEELWEFARDVIPNNYGSEDMLLTFLFVKQSVLMQMFCKDGPFNGNVQYDKNAVSQFIQNDDPELYFENSET